MYKIGDLLDIMKLLRSENGCPWDREQTHESIRFCLIEEAYEAADAISSGDADAMADELGDVLLQVVFHAQIGREAGTFTFDDVVGKVCEKMVRRHPHIFADAASGPFSKALTSGEVLENWDEIKKQEKGMKTHADALVDVVRSLPALTRAEKVGKKAAKVGFDFDGWRGPLEKVAEEAAEVEAAAARRDELAETNAMAENQEACQDQVAEEIGDLLFSVVNLARFLKVNPEDALTKSTDKFIARFQKMEQQSQKLGKNLCNLDKDELEYLYNMAK